MKGRFVFRGILTTLIVAGISQAQSISGTVTDAITKNPIAGVSMSIVETAKSVAVDSATGKFSCEFEKPGSYTVKVEAPRYLKFTKKVILTSSKEVGVSSIELNVGLYSLSSNADTSDGVMSVKYSFPSHGDVSIVILDDKGKTVRKAFDRSRAGGMRSFSWDGKDNDGKLLPAGHYTCKVVSGRLVMIRSLSWKGAS
jgi:hypothetical protein